MFNTLQPPAGEPSVENLGAREFSEYRSEGSLEADFGKRLRIGQLRRRMFDGCVSHARQTRTLSPRPLGTFYPSDSLSCLIRSPNPRPRSPPLKPSPPIHTAPPGRSRGPTASIVPPTNSDNCWGLQPLRFQRPVGKRNDPLRLLFRYGPGLRRFQKLPGPAR